MDKPVDKPVENGIRSTIGLAASLKKEVEGVWGRPRDLTMEYSKRLRVYADYVSIPRENLFQGEPPDLKYGLRKRLITCVHCHCSSVVLHILTNFTRSPPVHNMWITLQNGGGVVVYNNCNYMENLYLTRIVKIGSSLGVIIPVDVLKAHHLRRGDTIVFAASTDGHLVIKTVSDKQIKEIKIAQVNTLPVTINI